MNKNVVIMIYVNDVPLGKLDDLHKNMEEMLDEYNEKRITLTIQDEPVVFPR